MRQQLNVGIFQKCWSVSNIQDDQKETNPETEDVKFLTEAESTSPQKLTIFFWCSLILSKFSKFSNLTDLFTLMVSSDYRIWDTVYSNKVSSNPPLFNHLFIATFPAIIQNYCHKYYIKYFL